MDGIFTVVDFETTSLENPYAIEIAMIALDDQLQEISRYESVIRPPVQVSKKILGLTRLTSDQLESAPTFEDLWPDVHKFLNKRIFVAHSAQFENLVFYKEFLRLGIEEYLPKSTCTVQLSRKVLPDLRKYTLENLTTHFGIPNLESHQALSDVIATSELLRRLFMLGSYAKELTDSLKNSVVAIPTPQYKARPPQPRRRLQAEVHQVSSIVEKIKSAPNSRISITGTPAIGKENMASHFRAISLIYDKGPIVNSMIFVVRCDLKPGERKIQEAKSRGIPVISEALAMQILTEMNVY